MEGTGSTHALPPSPPSNSEGGALAPSAPPMVAAEEVDLMELGTETLWRVTLTSLNAKVADLATQDLLEVRRAGCVCWEEGGGSGGHVRRDERKCSDLCLRMNPGGTASANVGKDTAPCFVCVERSTPACLTCHGS